MAEIAGWESGQIDCVLTFSQAPIDIGVYHHFPANWFDILKTWVKYKGLGFTSSGSNEIKWYADADFSREWCRGNADQIESVLSKTGYIIKFANCPIVWVNKCKQR